MGKISDIKRDKPKLEKDRLVWLGEERGRPDGWGSEAVAHL